MCKGLIGAREKLQQAREDEEQRNQLHRAVLEAWMFAEYAVNVLLELDGRKPEQHHHQTIRVKELRDNGWLMGDYAGTLDKLGRFRLRASYGGYASEPSVHYSPRNVEDCLDSLDGLRAEVEGHLRKKGKLS